MQAVPEKIRLPARNGKWPGIDERFSLSAERAGDACPNGHPLTSAESSLFYQGTEAGNGMFTKVYVVLSRFTCSFLSCKTVAGEGESKGLAGPRREETRSTGKDSTTLAP